MKRTLRLFLFSIAALAFTEAASAQVTQTLNLRFPQLSALAITSNAVTLEIEAADPEAGTYTSASDNSTVLYQLNNYGSAASYLKIQAQLSTSLPDGVTLTVSANGTGGQSNVDLSDAAVVQDVVRNITASRTTHALTYTLSAAPTAEVFTLNGATVTYTVVTQ